MTSCHNNTKKQTELFFAEFGLQSKVGTNELAGVRVGRSIRTRSRRKSVFQFKLFFAWSYMQLYYCGSNFFVGFRLSTS